MVVKFSNTPLSENEMYLLSQQLLFDHRPLRIDNFQLREDIRQFSRRLRLRKFFRNLGHTKKENEVNLNKNLSGQPKEKDNWPCISKTGYPQCINLDQDPSHCSNDNLTSHERRALLSMRKRTVTIIIKPADEVLVTMLMAQDDCLSQVMNYLIVHNSVKMFHRTQWDAFNKSHDITQQNGQKTIT